MNLKTSESQKSRNKKKKQRVTKESHPDKTKMIIKNTGSGKICQNLQQQNKKNPS